MSQPATPRPLYPLPDLSQVPDRNRTPERPRPHVPSSGQLIGDAERDRVCQELADHFAAGRLTVEELDERTSRAVGARTNRDLAGLMADLPAPTRLAPAPRMPGPPAPASTAVADVTRAVVISMLGFISLGAALCTVMLLGALGVSGGSEFASAALAAFGASVATAGACYFFPRMRASTPASHD
ncbi:DUF1707 SHOCT-like domain-containing protein [Aestuariimicrobium soli]|uniref:DUF1707 SHOCT-like domain-containing protein n=1 Tax=Aestuariimicrobium soli TaxID=2035834 RepID=UPI003EBA067C